MKKKHKITLGIAVVLLLVALVVMKKQNMFGSSQLTQVQVAEVAKRTIVETVSANGKIQPQKDIKVSPFISGEIVELTVQEGDHVLAGQLLAKIDPKQYQLAFERSQAALNSQKASVAQARAALEQSKADFARTQLDYERNEQLWKKQVISAAEYENIKAGFAIAQAKVISAKEMLKSAQYQMSSSEATLGEAKENLTRTAVFAPQEGTVSLLKVEKGERVQGASQFSAGTELMRIANLNSMEVHVAVNENDIIRVAMGDTCSIEVDAYMNEKFKGVVTEIATSASTTGASADQITNFDVKIRFLTASYQHLLKGKRAGYSPFRPGMSASVEIATETKDAVPAIEIVAVTVRSDTTSHPKHAAKVAKDKKVDMNKQMNEYVFVYQDNKAVLREVKTGIQDSEYIEITAGLALGDKVIIGPYMAVSKTLRNKQAVEEEAPEEE